MPALTKRFTVVPVAQRDDGWLACDSEAVECATADDAAKVAKILARKPGYCAVASNRRAGGMCPAEPPILRAHAGFAHLAEGDLLRALCHRDQSTSAARFIAGESGFLTRRAHFC
jgi:hypothetical protein